MPSVMTSPPLRKTGGFMPRPTPGGVPVVMTSPARSSMNWLRWLTMVATPKIIVLVEPVCIRLPSTSSHMDRFCTSGISSGVTSHGPSGPKVGQPLPLAHCPPPRSI